MLQLKTNRSFLNFNGNALYGVSDGQQVGNWGTEFPVFARVKNGAMYAVGIEKNQNKADKDTVYKLSQAWLKNVFPTDYTLFQDVPHQQQDTDYPASDYIWANKSESFRQSFNRTAGPATGSPSTSTGGTTTTTSKTLKTVGIIVGVLVVIGLISAAVYFSKKRR